MSERHVIKCAKGAGKRGAYRDTVRNIEMSTRVGMTVERIADLWATSPVGSPEREGYSNALVARSTDPEGERRAAEARRDQKTERGS